MKKTNNKGFTLVELVIVIAVIAILAGVLIGTFATVIQRANQNKALQEWKAKVDEAYVEYVADYHTAPGSIEITANKAVKFGEKLATDVASSSTKTSFEIVEYSLDSASPARIVKGTSHNKIMLVLDSVNHVYFLWNEDSTYSVVATNADLDFVTDKYISYTLHATNDDPDALPSEGVTLQKLEYNNVVYYGVK